METVLWLVLGAIAGVLAMFAVYRSTPDTAMEWIGAIVLGIVGGWIGGFLADLLGLQSVNWLGSLIVAFFGAWVILLVIRNMAPRTRT